VTTSILLPTTNDTTSTTIYFPPRLILFYTLVIVSSILLRKSTPNTKQEKLDEKKIPFFSEYRSSMMLATAAAILAVDFPALFPRRVAKTETFGSSLMDLGVGSFVFSGGLVSAPARGSKTETSMMKIIRHNIPLLVLGGARFLTVSSTGYQTHVGEYGVHWNFFMTLLVVGVLVSVVDMFIMKPSATVYALLGVAFAVLQQGLLSFGMQTYVEESPRVTLFSANKEGICSILGYVSIYYFAVSLGSIIFATNRQPQAQNLWRKFSLYMTIVSIPLFVLCYVSNAYFVDHNAILKIDSDLVPEVGFETFSYQVPGVLAGESSHPLTYIANIFVPSRQMTNFGYILWSVTYNLVLLTWFSVLYSHVLPMLNMEVDAGFSVIREAVNNNQLATFLLANLATGAINIGVQTVLWKSETESFLLVLLYLMLVTIVMVGFYIKRWIVKL
jgi:phosphatidylinositol glycan class W